MVLRITKHAVRNDNDIAQDGIASPVQGCCNKDNSKSHWCGRRNAQMRQIQTQCKTNLILKQTHGCHCAYDNDHVLPNVIASNSIVDTSMDKMQSCYWLSELQKIQCERNAQCSIQKGGNFNILQACLDCAKLATIPRLKTKEKHDQPTKHIIKSVLTFHYPMNLTLDKLCEMMQEGSASEQSNILLLFLLRIELAFEWNLNWWYRKHELMVKQY